MKRGYILKYLSKVTLVILLLCSTIGILKFPEVFAVETEKQQMSRVNERKTTSTKEEKIEEGANAYYVASKVQSRSNVPSVNASLAFSSNTVSNAGAPDNAKDIVHNIKSGKAFNIKYTLAINVSSADFNADEISIELPASLLTYRVEQGISGAKRLWFSSAGVGSNKDNVEASVPFYYVYEYDSNKDPTKLTIKNAKPITGTGTYNIEFEYQVTPTRVISNTVSKIKASVNYRDRTDTSNELSYTYITNASLDSMSSVGTILYNWPTTGDDKYPISDLPEMDLTNYRYISYKVTPKALKDASEFCLSQTYTLEIGVKNSASSEVIFVGKRGSYLNTIQNLTSSWNVANRKISIPVKSNNVLNSYLGASTQESYFIVLRYPKDDSSSYTVDLEGSVIPEDEPNKKTSIINNVSIQWQDFNFSYPDASLSVTADYKVKPYNGDMGIYFLDMDKDHNLLDQVTTVTGGYYPKIGDTNTYGVTLISDLKYLADSTKTNAATLKQQELTSNDVYMKNIVLSIYNAQTSRLNGQVSVIDIPTRFADEEIKVSYKGNKLEPWGNEQIYTFSEFVKKNTLGKTVSYDLDITPPKDMIQVKVEYPSIFIDEIKTEMRVQNVIKHDSPVYNSLRIQKDENQKMIYYGFVGAIAKNSSNEHIVVPSKNNYDTNAINLGIYDYDLNSEIGLIRRVGSSKISKTIAQLQMNSSHTLFQASDSKYMMADTENQRMIYRYKAKATQGYTPGFVANELQDETVFQDLLKLGMVNPSIDNGAFYMLLPRNVTIIEKSGSFKVGSTTYSYSAPSNSNYKTSLKTEVVSENYKGTHRQLVKFAFTSNSPGLNRFADWSTDGSYNSGGALMGQGSYVGVDFYVSVPIKEASNANGTKILSTFLNSDDVIGKGFADDGGQFGSYNIMGDDGKPVFYNLAQKDDVDSSLLNTMSFVGNMTSLPGATAYSHGLQAFVRANDKNINTKFDQNAEVYVGNEYEYRLLLTNGQNTDLKEVILFNNLGQGTQTDTKTWRGTFKHVDISELVQKGLDPVVYYTTSDNAPYFRRSDVTNGTIPKAWTTIKPSNDDDIKGIAIDLSKKTDKNDFIMKEKDMISVYITMQSPSKMPSDGAIVELNSTTYSALIGNADVLPENTNNFTPNTKVTLLPYEGVVDITKLVSFNNSSIYTGKAFKYEIVSNSDNSKSDILLESSNGKNNISFKLLAGEYTIREIGSSGYILDKVYIDGVPQTASINTYTFTVKAGGETKIIYNNKKMTDDNDNSGFITNYLKMPMK